MTEAALATSPSQTPTPTSNSKIACAICGAEVHGIKIHLEKAHKEWSVEQYQEVYPGHPLLSPWAVHSIALRKQQDAEAQQQSGGVKRYFHEVFGLGDNRAARGATSNKPIPITVCENHEFPEMVPERDPGFVFDVDMLKTVVMGIEVNIPILVWGHAGTGKSTLGEQVAAYLNMPSIRIQHSGNTEESHVLGQTLINEKGTYFEPGPLAMAMRYGWQYIADEYDFAQPPVLAVYQPVLEGKPLLIKEAPPEWRMVKPHPRFRFYATGNTNGSGDETGLYQGTTVQNAANYSRFGICIQAQYMPASQEEKMLVTRTGCSPADAKAVVSLATEIREAFGSGKISNTIGPRELIYAVQLGVMRGSLPDGLQLAYSNKLPATSKLVVDQIAQRVLGK